jgi:hypothetical protein
VHHEFLRQGQRVNRWYYLEMLKRLRENIRRKSLSSGETTPGSSIMTMRQLMHRYWFVTFWPARTQLCFLSHPTHLISLRQSFTCFPNWNPLWKNDSRDKGKFADGATRDPDKAYQDSFQKWQRRWERCISAGGKYFEGDKAHSVAGTSEKI